MLGLKVLLERHCKHSTISRVHVRRESSEGRDGEKKLTVIGDAEHALHTSYTLSAAHSSSCSSDVETTHLALEPVNLVAVRLEGTVPSRSLVCQSLCLDPIHRVLALVRGRGGRERGKEGEIPRLFLLESTSLAKGGVGQLGRDRVAMQSAYHDEDKGKEWREGERRDEAREASQKKSN